MNFRETFRQAAASFAAQYINKDSIKVISGLILTAASFGLIILPRGFSAAGVTGLARILTGFIDLPISIIVFLISCSLLLLGLLTVGFSFIVKSIAVSLFFPVLLEFTGIFSGSFQKLSTASSIILAGLLLGIGSGLILSGNASSGGFDILGVVLNKKLGIPLAVVMNLCDSIIILIQSASSELVSTAYGLLVILISSICVGIITRVPRLRPRTIGYTTIH